MASPESAVIIPSAKVAAVTIPRRMPRWLPAGVIAVAVIAFAGWALRGIVANPGFVFLLPRDGAQWIRMPAETTIRLSLRAPVSGVFGTQFRLAAPLSRTTLYVAGFRSIQVFVDGKAVYEESNPVQAWKFERAIQVPGTLPAGDHFLFIVCSNDMGPPMIRARWPDANLRSGPDWFRVDNNGGRSPVSSAAGFAPPALALQFPTVQESFGEVFPWIAAVFVLGGLASWYLGGDPARATRVSTVVTPTRVRWAMLVGLLALAMNDMMRLPLGIGADLGSHYKYILYVAEHHRIPQITQNSQAFQAPLFYFLAAAIHEAVGAFTGDSGAFRSVRLISILSGLGLVEVGYRLARRAFVGNASAQCTAILMCATFPMALAKTQLASNEPLAGFLIAAAALAVLEMIHTPPDSCRYRRVFFAGALWGLAVLAKVSAVVLAAPLVLGIAWWTYAWPGQPRRKIELILIFLGTFGLTCGWYFTRTQWLYGKPVVGGWDPLMGFEWWQFPGYRTLDQYTSFKAALTRPIFCLVQGVWDGLYAGLWFDAEHSGYVRVEMGPGWNYPFAQAALPWAIAPTIALGAGCWSALRPSGDGRIETRGRAEDLTRCFALLVAGAFVASILGHSLVLPYYNAIKSTYALGAVPFIGILITAGAEPLMRRRWGAVAIHAWLAAWILLVFVGYWALAPVPLPAA